MRPPTASIRNRILEPGDMASPQKPVFTLALTDPLWVRAYVPETDLGKLHLGMRAAITTDSYPGKTLSRLDRLHLAHRRVHAQVGRDAPRCAPSWSIRCASSSAIRRANCAWACRRR